MQTSQTAYSKSKSLTSFFRLFVLAMQILNASAAIDYTRDIEPILVNYCYDCHGDGADKGDMALDEYKQLSALFADREKWMAVWKNVRAHVMPPANKKQPRDAERELIELWIEQKICQLDPAKPDPGHVTVRRLNRSEYRHTISDLLGVYVDTLNLFPPDDSGYGFDNIGDVLSTSPLLIEKYIHVANTIVKEVVPLELPEDPKPEDYPKNYTRVFTKGPPPAGQLERKKYARDILNDFAARAFRRPVDKDLTGKLVAMAMETAKEHKSFEKGIAQAMTAVLASPRFIFRAESHSGTGKPGEVVHLDEYELATRLSYFLWNSMPDSELFRLAEAGKLRENLHAQVDRMLKDEKSSRFVNNFLGQWLQLREVSSSGIYNNVRGALRKYVPDKELRRFTSRRMKENMRLETEMLFKYILHNDRSATELLTADYSFLNERLAMLYNIEGVRGDDMRLVKFKPSQKRGGILTHASILLITSDPNRTSPVKRGLFVIDNILGTPSPPPPPEVPNLEDAAKGDHDNMNARELMALHSKEKLCASCHARMDPIGFAFENYNVLGMWRNKDKGKPIDSSGKLITGEAFSGPLELAEVLATSRRKDFYRCLTEKMLTYALGRGVEYYDATTIRDIVNTLETKDGKLVLLIHAIVDSAPFQMQRLGKNR